MIAQHIPQRIRSGNMHIISNATKRKMRSDAKRVDGDDLAEIFYVDDLGEIRIGRDTVWLDSLH